MLLFWYSNFLFRFRCVQDVLLQSCIRTIWYISVYTPQKYSFKNCGLTLTSQLSASQSCGSLPFLSSSLQDPTQSQIFSCHSYFILGCSLVICMLGDEGVLAACTCVGLLWYAHSSTWCCVGGERCVTQLNLAFRRLGNSVLTVLFILMDCFSFLVLRGEHRSLRKLKVFSLLTVHGE